MDPFSLAADIDRKLAAIQRRASKPPKPARYQPGYLPTFWEKRLEGAQPIVGLDQRLEREQRLQTL